MACPSVRLLLVESDESAALAIQDALTSCKMTAYSVRHATSLAAASAIVQTEVVDIVLVALMLPDSEGEDTITVLRQATRNRVPIIVLTESEASDLITRSLQIGAQDVVAKHSFSNAMLCRTIQFAIHRKRLEVKLQEQARVTEIVISTIPHCVFWKDRDCNYLGCNQQFATAAGLESPGQIVGMNDYQLAWKKEESDFYRSCDQQVMDSDTPMLNFAETQKTASGQELNLLTSKVPLKNDDGAVIGILGMFLDITERRRLEEKLEERSRSLEDINKKLMTSQSQLVQSEKMASIGQLAAGVAHDINNPVGFVMSNLGTLAEYLQTLRTALDAYRALAAHIDDDHDDERTRLRAEIASIEAREDLGFILEDAIQLLDESQDGAKRIKEIVQNLRSFARLDEAQVAEVDLNKGIESTLNIVWNELKYKCTVTRDYGDIPTLRCFPGQLNQVFMNLLVNAGQAIEEKGEISIKTWVDDDEIHVRISDTGQGIPTENLSRLFDPFFTTKPVGKGTGLGLSVSYGIVQKHGGRIEVASEVGKGTAFTVSLPLVGATDAVIQPA